MHSSIFLINADARFIRKPTATKVILPNETATFECSVVGFGILNVNGRVLSESIDEFTSKGFRYSVEELSDGLQTFTSMKLSVKGVPSNNGSRIDCYGYSDNVIYFSSLLIIAGPPSAPEPQLLVLNSTALLLSWKKPFTWSQLADVISYTIKVYNSSNKQWREWTVKPSMYGDTNSVVINGDETSTERCVELTFVVSATNKIGESPNKSITGGIPIDMKWNGNPITASVHPHPLDTDSGADVIVQLQPLQMCSYQSANYTITVTSLNTGKKVAETTTRFHSGGGKQIEIQFPIAMSDFQDLSYVAEVNATILGANQQLVKSTRFSIPFTAGDPASDAQARDSNTGVLVGVAIVATVSVVLLLVLAKVAGAKCKRRISNGPYLRFTNPNTDDQFRTNI
eukprot:Em0006g627a